MNSSQITKITCSKHSKNVRLVCTQKNCAKGNLICDQCLQSDPDHSNIHRNFIFEFKEFLNLQSKMLQKFLPQLNENLVDMRFKINELLPLIFYLKQLISHIEKKFSFYTKHCENQTTDIDKDFAQLFKIFFTLSENAKTFLKDTIKEDQKIFQTKMKQIRVDLENLSKSKQKESNFFSSLFSKDEEEIDAKTPEEYVTKLIDRNEPLNNIRNDCIQLRHKLEEMDKEKVVYKQTQVQKDMFEEIREDFELSCKEMYRKFKQMMDGIEEDDMKKTMFDPDMSISEVNQSQFIQYQPQKQSQTQTISNLNLSRISSVQNLKNSLAQFDNEASLQLDSFPPINNTYVLQVLKLNEGFSLVTEGSYFNNIAEQGPFQYEDGSVYQGHMQNHKRHGRGKFLFADGAFYQGYWKDDAPYGFGRLIRPNGDCYEGMCVNFKANGKGTFTDFKQQYVYKGDWADDKKHGQGEEIFKSKYKYKGNFRNGLFHGQGEIQFADGTIYNGDFVEGQMNGQGTFKYPSGEQYLGQVINGKKNGKGIFIWADQRKYEGNYKDDVPDGEGLFFWPDGFVYNGEWSNGMQHGKGQEINPDGKERTGIWENGQWTKWIQ